MGKYNQDKRTGREYKGVMELFADKGMCCGCTACMSACAHGAIRMQPDEEGFLYPHIDASLCVECGRCKTVCTFQNGYDKSRSAKVPEGYAVKHKDEAVREASRSGGMFTAISDYVLELGGSVYGAGFGEHFKVVHKCAHTREERDEFRGSKYVQSDLGDCFKEIKEKLKNGEKVLFSGTACQTAALRVYCGLDLRKNLYLVDIVCHGVPSPLMWQEFLKLREDELKGQVEAVDFRNKRKFGWKAHHESIVVRGEEYSSRVYTSLFYKDVTLRPSCYNCIYTNERRPSDITLADFWGSEKAVPGFHEDDKGCSLVLGNTKKGCAWIRKVLKNVDYVDVTGYKYRHVNMRKPSPKPDDRDEFWQDYFAHGFRYVAEKYTAYHYEPYAKRVLKRVLAKMGLLTWVKKLYGAVKGASNRGKGTED